jgi:hypothetical protein
MSKRPSRPYRDLQARLLRALNEGFVPPVEHKTPFYRLRDGKAIRKASHLIVFQAMEDWDNRNGHTIPKIEAEAPVISSDLLKVVDTAQRLYKLQPEYRSQVLALVKLMDGDSL